jgi:hypothetical protein
MMRSELEARLAFASPTELLLATPISGPSQRLLGAYTSQAAGLRSETAPRERYSHGGAVAAVTAFYTRPGTFVYLVLRECIPAIAVDSSSKSFKFSILQCMRQPLHRSYMWQVFEHGMDLVAF